MNMFIKISVFAWLLFCAMFVWVACAVMGLAFLTAGWHGVWNITPLIGLTAGCILVKCAIYVLLYSNPIAYIDSKFTAIGAKFGKKI